MPSLAHWLVTHVAWVLTANLAAGCYALLAFLPELDLAKALRSPWLRVGILVLLAAFGIPLLVTLAVAELLHRRGLYYPPARRGR
jgi:hypothetical protein